MKNINKLKNGKWQFEVVVNGKRHRKNFSSKNEAINYANNYKSARKFELSFFTGLSGQQINDIKNALEILPQNKTLTAIVSEYIKNTPSDTSMQDAFTFYKAHLTSLKGKSPKLRMHKFISDFVEWKNVSDNKLLDWLKLRGMPKTIIEYYAQIKRFYEFAKRRKFIAIAPTDNITQSDLPKIQRSKVCVWDIQNVNLFFQFLKEKRPRFLNWFAIACFAGIRRAEINRIKPEYIDTKRKTILLPYDITKTGDTWLMEDLPDNLWKWIDSYGTKIENLTDATFSRLVEAWEKWTEAKGEKIPWQHNICRHSFCTYHLSLFRDPAKTSLLLKHREPNTMWQHYLAGLVDKKTAKKYFDIMP